MYMWNALNTGSHEEIVHSQSDCLHGNRDIAHGNYRESPDSSFAVCDTRSDPHWVCLGLACETRDLTI